MSGSFIVLPKLLCAGLFFFFLLCNSIVIMIIIIILIIRIITVIIVFLFLLMFLSIISPAYLHRHSQCCDARWKFGWSNYFIIVIIVVVVVFNHPPLFRGQINTATQSTGVSSKHLQDVFTFFSFFYFFFLKATCLWIYTVAISGHELRRRRQRDRCTFQQLKQGGLSH